MVDLLNRSILAPFIKNGKVDYYKLSKEKGFLEKVEEFEEKDISDYSYKKKFAFWLNAYNFLTVKAVLEILEKNESWNGNFSYWAKFRFFIVRKHRVAGMKKSLKQIEDKILRKEFKDPRIHFAINCASVSCPVLPGSLFDSEHLEEDLELLTQDFMNSDNVKYNKKSDEISLNQIFKWYSKDFEPSVLEFIKKYKKIESTNPTIVYQKYNWKVNSV